MTELTPGLVVGARFALIRRIGHGGTAEVWLAEDRGRGGQAALKFLDAATSRDAGLAGSIAQEAARTRSLPSRHVVAIREAVELEGRVVLVMDFQPGGDLGQFRGRSYELWARAADDVAAALEAAHAAGLVHRDLKCGNVLLDGEGRARLSDFALAAVIGGTAPAGGSPYNASPQQLRGEPASAADDLYALGAMLYELIAGHPPYYPEITRDRVLHEPVPALVPRGEVPLAVRELAVRLLAKSPQERPSTPGDVRARLAAAAGEASDVAPLAHAAPAVEVTKARANRWLTVALGVAVIAAIAAFIWVPKQNRAVHATVDRAAEEQAKAMARERQSQEEALAKAAADKVAAEASRDRFAADFRTQDERGAARWATAPFAQARDSAARAVQRYEIGDYATALADWNRANTLLEGIEKERPAKLAEAIQRGQKALALGRTAEAREALQFALLIDPQNAPAKSGIGRAARLDQAIAMADLAAGYERAGRVTDAAEGYRKALALDPAVPGASEGLARIAGRQAGEAYAAAMSRGLADLAAGRNDAARAAFHQALSLRPGAREARDALTALDHGQRNAAVALLESRARTAESEERWDDALSAWREAAGVEPTLASARDGIVRATPRAELQRRLDTLIREPERLWDPAGRAEARAVLATASATGNPRQRLAAAARQLESLAGAAETPVKLRLESDGVTSVTIYRVGQYGSFARRDVELLPGRYTVVGTRNGYRDVRREVLLPPGAPVSAVVVQCEDPI